VLADGWEQIRKNLLIAGSVLTDWRTKIGVEPEMNWLSAFTRYRRRNERIPPAKVQRPLPKAQDPKPKKVRNFDYRSDGLAVWGKNVGFLRDTRFLSAYDRGINSGHRIGDFVKRAGGPDKLGIEWRVHVCCWAASHARLLPGDLVECGVNTGIFSLAACEYIDFNTTGKKFWLFDTFAGIPESQMSETEAPARKLENAGMYFDCWDIAQKNFAPFPNAKLIRGTVPESLSTVEIDQVCYLSIDMNIAAPERAAIEHFWPKLVTGAVVVLDDYGWKNLHEQKVAMDDFANSAGTEIMTLPTGQGLLIKP
jgi:hypothetical protein